MEPGGRGAVEQGRNASVSWAGAARHPAVQVCLDDFGHQLSPVDFLTAESNTQNKHAT